MREKRDRIRQGGWERGKNEKEKERKRKCWRKGIERKNK